MAARRSHNPKVVSSILTRRIFPDLAEGLAYSVRSNVPECIGQQNEAGNMFMHHEKKTVCPSGLRGWTQVPLAQAAWVQIPQLSFCRRPQYFMANLSFPLNTPSPNAPTRSRNIPQQCTRRCMQHATSHSDCAAAALIDTRAPRNHKKTFK